MSKKKPDPSDHTINQSGPTNQILLSTWSGGWVERLVDSFIKDNWIQPEHRMQEISYLYRGNYLASEKNLNSLREIFKKSQDKSL